jgi:hypothetical protein
MAYHKVRKTPPPAPPVELLPVEGEAAGEAQAAAESV